MGYIYIIKNTVNNKVYIGQTIHSIDVRMKQHILNAKSGRNKLYRAMRELGEKHFYIELLEKVDNSELDDKENYYINKYDAINNGYNSVLNGECQHITTDLDNLNTMFDAIISDYIDGLSYTDLSIKYEISTNTLYKILYDYIGSRIDNKQKELTNKPNEMIMYDKDFTPICYFKSTKDAYEWLSNNSEFNIDKRNTYSYTKRACGCGNIAYGYRWQLVSDLIYDNKIFRTKFDKEAYIAGQEAYQPEGEQYWVVDGVLDNIINKNKIHVNMCKICGRAISVGAKFCRDCYDESRSLNIPDKDTLQNLLLKYNYTDIGHMYNVCSNTIKKWCKYRGVEIEHNERDSSGVTCIELNVYFDTFKKAAQYLIDNKYVNNMCNKTLAYNIGLAKKSGDQYKGFTWK